MIPCVVPTVLKHQQVPTWDCRVVPSLWPPLPHQPGTHHGPSCLDRDTSLLTDLPGPLWPQNHTFFPQRQRCSLKIINVTMSPSSLKPSMAPHNPYNQIPTPCLGSWDLAWPSSLTSHSFSPLFCVFSVLQGAHEVVHCARRVLSACGVEGRPLPSGAEEPWWGTVKVAHPTFAAENLWRDHKAGL